MSLNIIVGLISLLVTILIVASGAMIAWRLGSRSEHTPRNNNIKPNDTSDLHRNLVYNIVTHGNINIQNIPDSESITINIVTKSEEVNLEYRVSILEGYVNWMLTNGVFPRSIEKRELEEIRQNAIMVVKQRFPEADIEIKES